MLGPRGSPDLVGSVIISSIAPVGRSFIGPERGGGKGNGAWAFRKVEGLCLEGPLAPVAEMGHTWLKGRRSNRGELRMRKTAQRKLQALAFVLATCMVASGCYSVHYTTGARPDGPQRSEMNHHFLGGLVGTATVDLDSRCGGTGVARVTVEHSFVDMLCAVVTFGLWSPTTTTYSCAAGAADGAPGSGTPVVAGGAQ